MAAKSVVFKIENSINLYLNNYEQNRTNKTPIKTNLITSK